MNIEEFYAQMQSEPLAPFEPFAWYNEDGDSWEVFLEPGQFIVDRIDPLVSIRTAFEDRTHIKGFVLKNLRKHLPEELRQVIFCNQPSALSLRLVLSGWIFEAEFRLVKENQANLPDRTPSVSTKVLSEVMGQFPDLQLRVVGAGQC